MTLLAIFITGALLIILAIAVNNAWAFPRLVVPSSWSQRPLPATQQLPMPQRADSEGATVFRETVEKWLVRQNFPCPFPECELPAVSILIPARNEAVLIGETIQRLLVQDYPTYELILLDDDSNDGTSILAQAAAQGDPRLRVLEGAPLPPGWLGKNWACQQLAAAAKTDLLLFTDADVRWQPQALAALVQEMRRTQADLLTVWPTQQTVSWGERLIVPLMALALLAYLPVQWAHGLTSPLAAAANGQCLLFRRAAYQRCGGHQSVRDRVLEDVLLAQRIKANGLRLRMANGAGLIQCRMYHSWVEVLHGYTKNIRAGHGDSTLLLLLSTAFHLAIFVWPWLWLALGAGWQMLGWPWWPLTLVAMGITVRAVTAVTTQQRLGDALLMPISALLMTWIAFYAIWRHWRGGAQWKGRAVKLQRI